MELVHSLAFVRIILIDFREIRISRRIQEVKRIVWAWEKMKLSKKSRVILQLWAIPDGLPHLPGPALRPRFGAAPSSLPMQATVSTPRGPVSSGTRRRRPRHGRRRGTRGEWRPATHGSRLTPAEDGHVLGPPPRGHVR